MKEGDYDFAKEQEADGARILDVNVGVPGIDEGSKSYIAHQVKQTQSISHAENIVAEIATPENIEKQLSACILSGEKDKITKYLEAAINQSIKVRRLPS